MRLCMALFSMAFVLRTATPSLKLLYRKRVGNGFVWLALRRRNAGSIAYGVLEGRSLHDVATPAISFWPWDLSSWSEKGKK